MKTILTIIAVYVACVVLLVVFQRSMQYFPDIERPELADYPALAEMREVTLTTADGFALFAWYKAPEEGKPAILYLHGNGGHVGYRHEKLVPLLDAGYGLLLVEYRGYGGNPGSPTRAGLVMDAQAGLAFLKREGLADRLVYYGESLGTGIAAELTTEHMPRALVLEAPYTRISDVAQARYWFVPFVRWLLLDDYAVVEYLPQMKAPLLVLHGKQDIVIPVSHAQAVYDTANQPKELWLNSFAGHDDLLDYGSMEAVQAFLTRYVD